RTLLTPPRPERPGPERNEGCGGGRTALPIGREGGGSRRGGTGGGKPVRHPINGAREKRFPRHGDRQAGDTSQAEASPLVASGPQPARITHAPCQLPADRMPKATDPAHPCRPHAWRARRLAPTPAPSSPDFDRALEGALSS